MKTMKMTITQYVYKETNNKKRVLSVRIKHYKQSSNIL